MVKHILELKKTVVLVFVEHLESSQPDSVRAVVVEMQVVLYLKMKHNETDKFI
jgi:hypothetical protein